MRQLVDHSHVFPPTSSISSRTFVTVLILRSSYRLTRPTTPAMTGVSCFVTTDHVNKNSARHYTVYTCSSCSMATTYRVVYRGYTTTPPLKDLRPTGLHRPAQSVGIAVAWYVYRPILTQTEVNLSSALTKQ